MLLIVFYLIAIVAANLAVTTFGPAVSIVTAFVLIAFDLTLRDTLHERWEGKHLWRNMLVLIGTGSVLSALLNWNAVPIAVASFVAFLASGITDTAVYSLLGDRAKLLKVNGSNIISAAVDSFIFPAIAFSFPPAWGIVLGQWLAKVIGGALWSLVLFYPWRNLPPSDDDGEPDAYSDERSAEAYHSYLLRREDWML